MSQDTARAWAWTIDAGWMAAENAMIPAISPGFLYGETLFESVRAHKGIWLALREHYQRLVAAQHAWGWHDKLPNFNDLKDVLAVGLERLGAEEAYGRITVWPPSGGGPGLLPTTTGGCMILVSRINGPSDMILRAANIGIARDIGRDYRALPYDLKHGNYLPSLWGAREAKSRGLDDVILCRLDGSPVEASASNLVLFCGDRWVTPLLGRDGLDGIGRTGLIRLGVVEEVPVNRAELEDATALALVNSVRGLRLVSTFEGVPRCIEGSPIEELRRGWRDVVDNWLKEP